MKKIYLIDLNSFIYRMFFGLPEFSTKDGKIVNAIFGIGKFFVQQLVREKPDYIFCIKDAKGANFRHELYDQYKATRDKMPDNLRTQIADIEKMIELMGVPLIQIEGYEADDVIATLAENLGAEKYNDVYILTGDKDLYSLVTENVRIYDTMKKKVFGKKEATEKFGVAPERVIDYLSIVGDSSDNIPGVAGFGPKKAIELILELGSLENIYEMVSDIESGKKDYKQLPKTIQSCFKGKTFEKLLSAKDDAFLSKKLATLHKSVPLHSLAGSCDEGKINSDFFAFHPQSLKNQQVKDFFHSLEFHSLIGQNEQDLKTWKDQGLEVKIIHSDSSLQTLMLSIKKHPSKKLVLDTETTSLNPREAQICGVSVYLDDENIYYINRMHDGDKVSDTLLKDFFNEVFALDILIVGHNLKYDLQVIDTFLGRLNEKNDDSLGQIALNL